MYLVCPNCHAEYEAPAGMVPDGGRHVQCSACHTRWFATNRRAAQLTEESEVLKRLEARTPPHLKVVHDRQGAAGGARPIADAETVEDTALEAPVADDTVPEPKTATEPEPEPEKTVTEEKPAEKKPDVVEAAKEEKPDAAPKADYTTSESHVDPADLEKFMSQKVENPPKPDRKRLEPDPSQVMGTPNKTRPKPEPVETKAEPEKEAKPEPAKAEEKPEPNADTKSEPEAETEAIAETDADTDSEAEAEAKEPKKADREKRKEAESSKPKDETRQKAKGHDKPAKSGTKSRKKKRDRSGSPDADADASVRPAARQAESLASLVAEWPEEKEENRFLRGFTVPVAGFVILLVLYAIAGLVSSDFPAVGPILAGLEEVVDGFRRAMAIVFPKEG